MTHLVAISPHLDDAAFSVGGLLAAHVRAGGRVTIVTCFTGNVPAPTGFALACQLDKGLPADVDYMALRRAEDRAACAVIGATAVHLPLLEAPHRGYDSARALFGSRRPDDPMLAPLSDALAAQLAALEPITVLGPLAIGDHVDHWLVRDALVGLNIPLWLWEDWPYALRATAVSAPGRRHVHPLRSAARRARFEMCAAYTTQLGYQFGSVDRLEAALSAVEEERVYEYIPPD